MEKTTLIFINCQGLGLQIGSQLDKIVTAAQFVTLDARTAEGPNVAYLVTDGGNYLCTVMADRADYETMSNQDRRVGNVQNGFDVNWHNDHLCAISRAFIPKPKGRNTRGLVTLGIALASLIIGVLLGWFVSGSSSADNAASVAVEAVATQADDLKETEIVEVQGIAYVDTTVHVEGTEKQSEQPIKAQNDKYKRLLQSDKCSLATVNEVENWWKSLSKSQKGQCEYNFENALRAYKQFFYAKTLDDLSRLHGDQIYFSNTQRRVLEKYMKNAHQFRALHDSYGCQFDRPIKDGLGR